MAGIGGARVPGVLPNSRLPWALVSMLHRGNSGGNRPFLGTRESAMRSPRQLRRSAAQLFRAALGVFGICFELGYKTIFNCLLYVDRDHMVEVAA